MSIKGEISLDLLDRFENYIKNEGLVEKGDSIFLGVSGGPDSLTMLDLFPESAISMVWKY